MDILDQYAQRPAAGQRFEEPADRGLQGALVSLHGGAIGHGVQPAQQRQVTRDLAWVPGDGWRPDHADDKVAELAARHLRVILGRDAGRLAQRH